MWALHRSLWWFARIVVPLAGILFIAILAACFTSYPWHAYMWLSKDNATLDRAPDYIVVLGGGGIPSESGLIRTYHGAEEANRFKDAKVIVALTEDKESRTNFTERMKEELVLRGVSRRRILTEPSGRNTREQALNVAKMVDHHAVVLVVSSPYHMKRALGAFRKAGFSTVVGSAAYDTSVKSKLAYKSSELGGNALPVPDIGDRIELRYDFWNSLRYAGEAGREWCALSYYWLRGWI